MPRPYMRRLACMLAIVLAAAAGLRAQDPPPLPVPPAGVDVQARGPVHEAFAEPTGSPPVQGPVVAKQPPAPVEELPPDQKPDGDNVQWIPGYWAWDDEAGDFLWVSGCWRVPPPGLRWVPGHWQEVNGGWLWVNGFWAPDGGAQVQYLPPPPPSLDQGPSSEAPDGNSVYAPGAWVYNGGRYLWRPGFWVPFNAGWVWAPASYVWTPGGCLFIDGYWDHPYDHRGFLFAPCRFNFGLWGGGAFTPQFVIQPDFLLGALFARPAYRRFYFGDYFDPLYERRGFVAWPDYHPTPRAFDPAFAYYRRLNGGDSRWEPSLKALYSARRAGEVPRPPRTLVRQEEVIRGLGAKANAGVMERNIGFTHLQNATVLTPLNRINTVRVTNLAGLGQGKPVAGRELKTIAVTREEHERELKSIGQMRAVSVQRRENENKMLHEGDIPVKHTDPPRPVKLEVPKPLPHVVERPVQRIAPARVEPPAHEERPIPKYEPAHPPEPRRDKK